MSRLEKKLLHREAVARLGLSVPATLDNRQYESAADTWLPRTSLSEKDRRDFRQAATMIASLQQSHDGETHPVQKKIIGEELKARTTNFAETLMLDYGLDELIWPAEIAVRVFQPNVGFNSGRITEVPMRVKVFKWTGSDFVAEDGEKF